MVGLSSPCRHKTATPRRPSVGIFRPRARTYVGRSVTATGCIDLKFRGGTSLIMRALASAFLALVAAVALAFAASADVKPRAKGKANASGFTSTEQLLKWINEYRKHPEPDRLPKAVEAMRGLGALRDLDQAGIYLGFVAGVLGSNPDKAALLVERMFPLPPEDQVVVIKALAFSGLPDWKVILTQFVERMPARVVLIDKYLYGKLPSLDDMPIDESPFVLDVHWGYYFATGSDKPVKRIISALALSKDKNKVERLTLGSMVKWTLATNAQRDEALLDICKAELGNQPKDVAASLRDVIDAAETYETGRIRKEAMASIDELKVKGSEASRNWSWWGQAGQTALGLGCIAASVTGHVEFGLPCVLGGALSSAALKYLGPEK